MAMLTPFWRLFAGPTGRLGGRPNLSQIMPALLVGEFPTPDDAEWLRTEHGVTVVLSLQDDGDLAAKGLTQTELEATYREQQIEFHRVPVPDGDTESLSLRLDRVLELMQQYLAQGDCIYLHCNAGLNRAPTVAIAYLHTFGGMSLAAARDLVKQRRHCVPYMRFLEARYPRA